MFSLLFSSYSYSPLTSGKKTTRLVLEAGRCIISFLIYYHAPPPVEVIIMTTTIIIVLTLAMTLLIVCFNMKDVCFSKYTPAVLNKELRQAIFYEVRGPKSEV